MRGSMPMAEGDWQVESDARTLSEAETIKADSGRMNKAQIAAAKLLKEKEEEAKALAALANAKLSYPNSPEMGGKK